MLRMPKYIVLDWLMFIACFPVHAQHIAASSPVHNNAELVKPLLIGQKVPDIAFDDVINYTTNKSTLFTFKRKLTILDFWSSTCSSCIGLFPHMQELQNEFKDQLQIVLVNTHTKRTKDDAIKAKKILERLKTKTGQDIALPIVMNCDTLDGYFPCKTIPHEVWIDENGAVLAITYAAEVNAANIKAILEGKKVSMHVKMDVHFDLQEHSLFELVYGTNPDYPKPLSSSILIKGGIDGFGGGMGLRRDSGNLIGFYMTNVPLVSIFRWAYRKEFSLPYNRVVYATKDSLLFKAISYYDATKYEHLYCIDVSVARPVTDEDLQKYVQVELDKTFHLSVVNEKRRIKCLVVTATAETKKCFTKGGESIYAIGIDAKKYIRNYPLSDFLYNINADYFSVPLINQTGIDHNVDIDLPHELTQENIIMALQRAGFVVKEEERPMDVVVITDKQ